MRSFLGISPSGLTDPTADPGVFIGAEVYDGGNGPRNSAPNVDTGNVAADSIGLKGAVAEYDIPCPITTCGAWQIGIMTNTLPTATTAVAGTYRVVVTFSRVEADGTTVVLLATVATNAAHAISPAPPVTGLPFTDFCSVVLDNQQWGPGTRIRIGIQFAIVTVGGGGSTVNLRLLATTSTSSAGVFTAPLMAVVEVGTPFGVGAA